MKLEEAEYEKVRALLARVEELDALQRSVKLHEQALKLLAHGMVECTRQLTMLDDTPDFRRVCEACDAAKAVLEMVGGD